MLAWLALHRLGHLPRSDISYVACKIYAFAERMFNSPSSASLQKSGKPDRSEPPPPRFPPLPVYFVPLKYEHRDFTFPV